MTTTALQEQPADPIAPAEPLLPVADGVERSLDPRWVRVERIGGWIVTLPILCALLGALVLVLTLAPLPGWIKGMVALGWAALSLGLAWLAHRWPEVAHRHASYKVDPRGIEIRRGVFWRKVINVPRSRVQHTDVAQGPIERAFGLATLVLYTAGTEHARVDLRGIDHGMALRLRDHLVAGEGDDAV
ncbi:MAG TPA: PH domain-containing protein [Thermoanaerobaculia bacterium]|nr:PH domain-containing protein [Thermoanaerobaculia bacterium]